MACWENNRGVIGLESREGRLWKEAGKSYAEGRHTDLEGQSQDSGFCFQCDEKPAESFEQAEDPV